MRYRHLYIYQVEGEVDDRGITSPDYIGCWNEGNSSFLFFHTDHRGTVEALIRQGDGIRLIDAYDMDYEDWQGEGLKAFRVGPLWFCPPRESVRRVPTGCRPIPFDPGVVFGTGLHPTTYDTLHLLVHLFNRHAPRIVLDLGTGTGILALACAALGAQKVLAVDINRLSVKTAQENVMANGFEPIITVKEASAESVIDQPADLAVMNMHFHVLDRLTETEGFRNKRWAILSGLLRTDYMGLLRKLQKRRHLVEERSTGHWFSAWFEG